MGSRGQALKSGGFTEYKYHTIARYNNVRFVVQNDNWNKHYKLTEMSTLHGLYMQKQIQMGNCVQLLSIMEVERSLKR